MIFSANFIKKCVYISIFWILATISLWMFTEDAATVRGIRHLSARVNTKKFASHNAEKSVTMDSAQLEDFSIEQTAKDFSVSNVHIFYYPWYGNPDYDGEFLHWNHEYLRHWNDAIADKYIKGKKHEPPNDIGSSFYPLLGPYSSRDPSVIDQHMLWISTAKVSVVVTSWYPPGLSDSQGKPLDDLIPDLLDSCEKYKLKLTFHMEPYSNRSAATLNRDIKHIIDNYGNHPAFYKVSGKKSVENSNQLPLLYFYDSYLLNSTEWEKLTMIETSEFYVRGTKYDVLFIGLLVKPSDKYSLLNSGFDGIYTYFASSGFTHGSTPSVWPSISVFCRRNKMFFIPSVGPGYDDVRIRPWNAENTKNRSSGNYYQNMFEMAAISRADIVSITSFNEWHEGTQIEPAVPFKDSATGFVYNTYEKNADEYLNLTKMLIEKFVLPERVSLDAQV